MNAIWLKRRLLHRLAVSTPVRRLLEAAESYSDRQPDLLRVLTYHRIDDPEAQRNLDPTLLSADPHRFAEQMAMVSRLYRVVTAEECVARLQGGSPLPPRAVLLTFDDAYIAFRDHALPALERLGLPALLFVPTAYPGDRQREFWWDRLFRFVSTASEKISTPIGDFPAATTSERRRSQKQLTSRIKLLPHREAMAVVDEICKSLPASPSTVLDWDALRRLEEGGIVLAPHSRSHPMLDGLGTEELEDEVAGSWHDLQREAEAPSPLFAYPAGRVSASAVAAVARAGLAGAFTTQRGANSMAAAERYRLRRYNVGRTTTPELLRAQLALAALARSRR